jgi:non-homologous end joining protein Ku
VVRDGDKSKLAAVRAVEAALVMQNIVWANEVNDVAELPILAQHVELDFSAVKTMVEMLDGKSTSWCHDTYSNEAA